VEFLRRCRQFPRRYRHALKLAPQALLSTLAAVCLVPAANAAEPKVERPAEQAADVDVRTLMRRGLAAQESGDHEGARAAFLEAWAKRQHFAIAVSLAEVEMQLGNYKAAAAHWEYYLEHLPHDLDERRAKAESELEECRSRLGRLRISAPLGAALSVDGDVVGKAPFEGDLWVDPGEHQISIQDASGKETSKAIVVSAGKTYIVDLDLTTKPAATERPAPDVVTPASPTLKADEQGEMEETHSNGRIWVLVGGGALSMTAAGIGVGYWMHTARLDDQVRALQGEAARQGDPTLEPNQVCSPDDRPPICGPLTQRVKQHNRAADTTRVAFTVAGGLAVITAATYLLWPTDDSVPERAGRLRPVAAPWLSAEAGGVTVFSEF
jgi:tetratricopeptide (TPR) repeat protein